MRRALGLLPGGEKPARPQPTGTGAANAGRNARVAGQGINRVAVAEAALATERQARERAEKALSDAEAAMLKLTTRLGQIELARDEAVAALAAERRRREEIEAELARIAAAPAPAPAPAAPPSRAKVVSASPQPPKKRGRKPAAAKVAPEPEEEQPVEWWVPGWRSR